MTALHQAAQKAVEALKRPEGDWSLSAALAVMNEARDRLESALQQQPEPVAWVSPADWEQFNHMHETKGTAKVPMRDRDFGGYVPLYTAPPALQEVPREPAYGSTDLTDGIAIAGMSLADGDKRLVALLLTAFGPKHPAIDDLVALLFRARSAASPSTTQQQEAGSGWKLVPETITEEMHVAAVRTAMRCSGNDDFPRRVWRAMLAAAPSTPEEGS